MLAKKRRNMCDGIYERLISLRVSFPVRPCPLSPIIILVKRGLGESVQARTLQRELCASCVVQTQVTRKSAASTHRGRRLYPYFGRFCAVVCATSLRLSSLCEANSMERLLQVSLLLLQLHSFVLDFRLVDAQSTPGASRGRRCLRRSRTWVYRVFVHAHKRFFPPCIIPESRAACLCSVCSMGQACVLAVCRRI